MRKNIKNFPSAEYRLLELLKPYLNYRPGGYFETGSGDDAAVRKCGRGERLVCTADTLIESRHFSFKYMSIREAGYKAMAVNLSDCAAMGAVPDGALVQVAFPSGNADIEKAIVELYRGLHAACRRWRFPIVGGNLSGGPCWIIDITLIGRLSRGSRPLLRAGAKKGDILWVTGNPGESRAGLELLRKYGRNRLSRLVHTLAIRHIAPEPRVAAGRALAAQKQVHAAIDISDGVSKECLTLSCENNLVIELDITERLASSPLKAAARLLGKSSWVPWLLHGGEDYELLFAASPSFDPRPVCRASGVCCRPIGRFVEKGYGVFMRDTSGNRAPVENAGWDHLRHRK